jgi:hypothetical protein
VAKRFYELLESEDQHVSWRACEWALKNIFGYRDDRPMVGVGIAAGDNEMRLSFVLPSGKQRDIDDIDERAFAARPVQQRPLPPPLIESYGSPAQKRPRTDELQQVARSAWDGKGWMK